MDRYVEELPDGAIAVINLDPGSEITVINDGGRPYKKVIRSGRAILPMYPANEVELVEKLLRAEPNADEIRVLYQRGWRLAAYTRNVPLPRFEDPPMIAVALVRFPPPTRPTAWARILADDPQDAG